MAQPVIAGGDIGSILINNHLIAGFYREAYFAGYIFLFLDGNGFTGKLFTIQEDVEEIGRGNVKIKFFGLQCQMSAIRPAFFLNFIPEFLVVVGVLVLDVAVQIRGNG
ncbi:hypothetical protein D3C73_1063510 [compost metagenome]